MTEKFETTVELRQKHLDYLEQMAQKHNIVDSSKALRCLINFAIERHEVEDDIFTQIRCGDC